MAGVAPVPKCRFAGSKPAFVSQCMLVLMLLGFPVAQAQTKTKTNIFAYGYENGERVSIGGP